MVDDAAHAIDAANAIAPEHLELMCRQPELLVPLVRNAGAVFVGPYAPAVIGDYVAGTNHVLPTGGTARFASALRVADFQKHIHVVHADAEALQRVGPATQALARRRGPRRPCRRGADARGVAVSAACADRSRATTCASWRGITRRRSTSTSG